jgi:3-dehydroquinate synthase
MTETLHSHLFPKQESYAIEFIQDVLRNEQALKSLLEPYSSNFAIIVDESVVNLYGKYLFSFPAGEKYKTRESKTDLENAMLEKGFGRDSAVIALGGGIVTDVAGFIAATYARGIPLIMIPTTLLGMVDASIGGKNGVNTPYGKNLIGTIYQPKKIIIDISTLKTLPLREIRNGMIKHGLIVDKGYFDFLSDHGSGILALDPSLLTQAIVRSCKIKNDIVGQDECESGKRHWLNFGHTVGHALEKTSDYVLAHGEAVAIGLLVESYISMHIGQLSSSSFQQIKGLLEKYGLPLSLPANVTTENLMKAMALDKKSLKNKPRFVVIKEIGVSLDFGGSFCTTVEDTLLLKALDWMIHDLCRH